MALLTRFCSQFCCVLRPEAVSFVDEGVPWVDCGGGTQKRPQIVVRPRMCAQSKAHARGILKESGGRSVPRTQAVTRVRAHRRLRECVHTVGYDGHMVTRFVGRLARPRPVVAPVHRPPTLH